LVWCAIFVVAGNGFFLAYQNMWAVMANGIAADRAWSPKHLGIYGTVYFIAALVSLIIVIPLWIRAGYFG
jgi:hypothetical protein